MNILREVRRVNKKSMPVRIISLLVFSLMLMISTFAWFTADKKVRLNSLEGGVTSWDVAYYVNEDVNQILDQTATFVIDEFYPGMPVREDVVHIYNVGLASTRIEYELISVKIFGTEVLSALQSSGEIQTDTTTNTTNLFSKDTDYPFNVSYAYDKDYLNGKYVDESTPNAAATLRFNVNWDYGTANRADEISAKDILDTKFGQDAYEHYKDGNDLNSAMEIKVKITSHMIHPSVDTGSAP